MARTSLPQKPVRWFEDRAMRDAAASLVHELSRIDGDIAAGRVSKPRVDDSRKMVWGVVAIVVIVVLLGVAILAVALRSNPDHRIPEGGVLKVGLLLCALPIMAFLGARYFYGTKSKRIQQRNESLDHLTGRIETLRNGHASKITGTSVGTVPWLASELDMIVECDLYGSYAGHHLAVLQCTHVVDMSLSALEATCGKLAASVMSHVQHEHIRRRCLDAVVFLEPIPSLPDIFLASKKQPLNWYFKRMLGGRFESMTAGPYWLASSDPHTCREVIWPQVESLLRAHPDAVLQVLGGYVVVIPQTWNANRPMEMPHLEEEVESNLRTACSIYDALQNPEEVTQTKKLSTESCGTSRIPLQESAVPVAARGYDRVAPAHGYGQAPAPGPHQSAALSANSDMTAASVCAGAHIAPRKNWWLRGLALFCAFGFLMVGGVVALAMAVTYVTGNNTTKWPSVEGRIVESSVSERDSRLLPYSAHVAYEYEIDGKIYRGDELTYGPVEWVKNKGVVEEVIVQYPQGQSVQVHYDPHHYEKAILKPGLARPGMIKGIGAMGGGMVLFAFFLVYLGLRPVRQ